mmetsp:Transcript_11278/g.30349  ORF Transcript_11278/g.30349 Transcript_11278/m.30349 type:complete len:203 (-) Transcript_11278:707-1315(-)
MTTTRTKSTLPPITPGTRPLHCTLASASRTGSAASRTTLLAGPHPLSRHFRTGTLLRLHYLREERTDLPRRRHPAAIHRPRTRLPLTRQVPLLISRWRITTLRCRSTRQRKATIMTLFTEKGRRMQRIHVVQGLCRGSLLTRRTTLTCTVKEWRCWLLHIASLAMAAAGAAAAKRTCMARRRLQHSLPRWATSAALCTPGLE